jgi:hypothetical protein
LVDGHDVELWHLDRLVMRFEPPHKLPSAMSEISIDTKFNASVFKGATNGR